jgi:hypothetical protein
MFIVLCLTTPPPKGLQRSGWIKQCGLTKNELNLALLHNLAGLSKYAD